MKRVSVCIAGSGEHKDVEIQPGTTVGDLLSGIRMENYLLSRGPGEGFLAKTDSLYEQVRDGQKVFASTPAEVGR